MNNQKLVIIGGVFVLLLLLGGGFLVMSSQKKTNGTPTPSIEQFQIAKLSPKDIGLELVPKVLSNDGKQLKVVVSKISDIKRLDYEIVYEADVPQAELPEGETVGRVERSIGGDVDITESDTEYESEFLDFGSASKNVVRYDTGVTEARIIMKVTKRDGKLYQVEDSISFVEE